MWQFSEPSKCEPTKRLTREVCSLLKAQNKAFKSGEAASYNHGGSEKWRVCMHKNWTATSCGIKIHAVSAREWMLSTRWTEQRLCTISGKQHHPSTNAPTATRPPGSPAVDSWIEKVPRQCQPTQSEGPENMFKRTSHRQICLR